MARFSGDGQDYTRALALGTQAALTVSCWLKISVNRATWSTPWSIDNGTGDNWLIQTGADGVTLGTVFDATSQQNMGALTVGTWYFVALAMNGSNGFLYHKTAATGLSTVTVDGGTASVNAATLRIGESPWGGEWWNGCIAAMKVWTAQLSAAEVANEAVQYQPHRVANLAAFYPLVRPETTDYSGNARTLSGGTGATREDGPPIPWGVSRPRIVHVVTGGGGSVTGTAAAPFGALTATASGTPAIAGTATTNLGGLTAAATGATTAGGLAAAPLGALLSTASGGVTANGLAAAPLGGLAATATGLSQIAGTASAVFGRLAATATGTVTAAGGGNASASLGPLAASGTGTVIATAVAASQLGALAAAAAGLRTVSAAAAAVLGGLTATAHGATFTTGTAAALLGALTVGGVVVPPTTRGGSGVLARAAPSATTSTRTAADAAPLPRTAPSARGGT